MKKPLQFLICGLLLAFALSSCKIYPPVYKRIDNFSMEPMNKDGFKVGGSIVLYNPNKLHVKLNDLLLNVELNGKHVATVGQQKPAEIKSKSDFSIPLDLVIKLDMTLKEGIQNIFSMITKKEVDVTIQGVVVIKAYGIKASIPIKQQEKVNLTKLK